MDSDRFFVNVECAIYKDEKWLMIVRSQKEEHAAGMLSMVGGIVEYSDSESDVLEAAMRREIMEEVGIKVSDQIQYLESKHFTSDNGERVLDIVFMAEYLSGEPTAISVDEVESVQWMTMEEIRQHPKTPPWIVQSMERAEIARKTL